MASQAFTRCVGGSADMAVHFVKSPTTKGPLKRAFFLAHEAAAGLVRDSRSG